jgi:hypothetical protein
MRTNRQARLRVLRQSERMNFRSSSTIGLLLTCSVACGGSRESPPAEADESDLAASKTIEHANLSAMTESLHEHEPSVAVSPNGHAVVSWLAYKNTTPRAITIGYSISCDDGQTWSSPTLVPVPADENTQANSSVAADDEGNLYLAWGAESHTATGRANPRVYVAKAGPRDRTFGDAVEITDKAEAVEVYDLPRVSVTSSGTVHVTYLKAGTGLSSYAIVHASSADRGATWARTTIAGPGSDGSYRNFARICHSDGPGRIFLAYADEDVGGIALMSSDDDGRTWANPVAVSTPDEADRLGFYGTDCVVHGSDVSVLYTLTPDEPTSTFVPTLTNLRLAHSGDHGRSFDQRSDVADPVAGARTMYPSIAIESRGSLDLTYYAGAAADGPAALVRSRAADGRTFAPSVPVHGSLKLETSRTAPTWVGDYIGSAVSKKNLYTVYVDNSLAAPHVTFQRTSAR